MKPEMGSDEAHELGCTCRAREVWPTDISPPEVKLDKWCPVHGRDPDHERDRAIDDRLNFPNGTARHLDNEET